jgi:hypothetical protein
LVFSLHKTLPNFQTLALLLLLPLCSSVPFVPVLFRKRLEELALGGAREEKKGFQAL